jgi:HlyD family secretion protein/macrolide-specific efflux system membrane fusion protein
MSDDAMDVRIPTIRPVSLTGGTTDGGDAKKTRRPAKRRRRWPWLLGIVAIGGAGLFVAQRSRAKETPIDPAQLVTVTKKALAVEIFETGRIQPREKAELKSKVAGQVLKVFVEEGATVKQGDVLLTLDPTDYQRELARSEADVAQAEAALDFAKISRDRAERGAAQGIAPQFDVQQTTHDERTKVVSLRAAEVARNISQDRLHYTRLVAPMSGTVIARNIDPGEAVIPGPQATMDGKPLLTIADLSTILVKVNLNQIDVAKVAVGRKATLTLDALPGKSYEAVITKVAPASVKLKDKEQEVFPVEAQLEQPDGLVKPGMTADVRVHLDSKPNVLVVPLETIIKEGGRSYVMKVVEEKGAKTRQEKVEVTTGMRNDREVEITGVDEGTRVMLKPASASDNEIKM